MTQIQGLDCARTVVALQPVTATQMEHDGHTCVDLGHPILLDRTALCSLLHLKRSCSQPVVPGCP